MVLLPGAAASQFTQSSSRLTLCLFFGAVSLGTFGFWRSVKSTFRSDKAQVIPSRKETLLPQLSEEEVRRLPYPPDALPGARDVDSPYGRFRVYEWGPEDGSRILLIHGISTPSIALGPLAHELVKKGCRVMLFDLFGRGYSSTPTPTTNPQTPALFTTQILLTLSSSLLPWPTFTLIGYSLGGALAADFTSYFPHLVTSLFLLAPGGLIRSSHISWKTRMLYSTGGWLPEAVVESVVRRRLWSGRGVAGMEPEGDGEGEGIVAVGEKEEEGQEKGGLRSKAVYTSSQHRLLPGNPHSTVGNVVDWQIEHNAGFIPAFISSIRYAPIHGQQPRWKIIGQHLREQEMKVQGQDVDEGKKKQGLKKVHLVLGETDPIIIADELVEDVKEVLGEEYVDVTVMQGSGHEVAIEKAVEIAELVGRELGL